MAPTWLATSPNGSEEREIRDDYESDSDEERQPHSPTSPNNDASSITLLEGEALVTCDEPDSGVGGGGGGEIKPLGAGAHASDKDREQAENSAAAHPGRASMDPSASKRESLLGGMFLGDEPPQSLSARRPSPGDLPHLLHAESGTALMASPSGHGKDEHTHFPDPFAEGGRTSSGAGGTPKGAHETGGTSSGGTPRGAQGTSRASPGEGSEGSHSMASLRARRRESRGSKSPTRASPTRGEKLSDGQTFSLADPPADAGGAAGDDDASPEEKTRRWSSEDAEGSNDAVGRSESKSPVLSPTQNSLVINTAPQAKVTSSMRRGAVFGGANAASLGLGQSEGMTSPVEKGFRSMAMRSRTGESGELASFASGSFEEGEDEEGEEVQVVSKSYLVYDDNLETRALSKGWNRHLRDHPHETAGNKYAFAIKMYTKIIDNNPHSSDALLSRSWAYYMRGMYMDAFDDAAEALEYAQTNVTCYLRAGAALEAIGQVEDAYGVFQEALEIDQKDVRLKKAMSEVLPLVLRERGSAAVIDKDFVKAAKLFAEGGQLKGQLRPWFLVSESRAHSMAGSANLARSVAHKVVNDHPRYVDGYQRLCEALVTTGDIDGAREVAMKGIQHDPSHEGMTQLLMVAVDQSSPMVTSAKQMIKNLLQSAPDAVPNILKEMDLEMTGAMHSAIGKVWKAALTQLLPEHDEEDWEPSSIVLLMLFDLRQALPGISRDDAWKKVSLISHKAFSLSGSENRPCFVDMAIAGWKELHKEAVHRKEERRRAEMASKGSFSRRRGGVFVPTSHGQAASQGAAELEAKGRQAWTKIRQATNKTIAEKAVGWMLKDKVGKDVKDAVQMSRLGLIKQGTLRGLMLNKQAESMSASPKNGQDEGFKVTERQQAGLDLCLGFAYLECTSLPKEQVVELAIACFEEAIFMLNRDKNPQQWAAAHHGAAKSYQQRVQGYLRENVNTAVRHLSKAMLVYTPEDGAVRHAGLQLEIGSLYAKSGDLVEGLSHMELALKVMDDVEFDEAEAALWAHVHCSIAQALMDDLHSSRGTIRPDKRHKTIEAALSHYEQALEVYLIEKYPIPYVVTKSRAAATVVDGATKTIFDMHGLVCLFQGNRTKLLIAYKEYLEALAAGEAIGLVVRGMGLSMSKIHHDSMQGLDEAFSGCIKTAIRLGMYAEALALSERARGHSISSLLLSAPFQQLLLKNVPAATVAQYIKLKTKLDAHRQRLLGLGQAGSSSKYYKGMLRCAGAFIGFLFKLGFANWNEHLRLLFMHIPQIEERPSVWEKEPVASRDEAMIEWFFGHDSAFAFIVSFEQHSPKTIEYTPKQVYELQTAIQGLHGSLTPTESLHALAKISKALRIDTVLSSLPPGITRLVLVPHGPLMEVPIHALPLSPSNYTGDDGILNRAGSSGNRSKHADPLHQDPEYVCDKFPIGIFYSYGIRLLSWLRGREESEKFRPIMTAVAIGKPRKGTPVPYADTEVKAVRGVINKVRILSDSEVTSDRINQDVVEAAKKGGVAKEAISVQNSDVLHVSAKTVCHADLGFAAWMETADDTKSLTQDVAAWSMSKCRIVNLCSHEFARGQAAEGDHSGVTYGGLPTGFIVAGANCVINSYWIVEHECRVVFWAKFYEALTNKGLDVAETLKATQVWMRDVRELEYVRSFPKEMQGGDWEERVERVEAGEGQFAPEERPFLSPYYWAAYAVVGDGSVSGKLQQAVKKKYDYSAAIKRYETEHPDFDPDAKKD